ncbi:hypothetical protein IFM89_004017, partial [Coptis chinensis]
KNKFGEFVNFEAYEIMNRKGLAILMRSRMMPSELSNKLPINISGTMPTSENNQLNQNSSSSMQNHERELEGVRASMNSAILTSKTDIIDSVLNDFSEGYVTLSFEDRKQLLLVLAREYDVNRTLVRELIQQYLGLEPPSGEKGHVSGLEESLLTAFYRTERSLRRALQPKYEILFERLNTHPGGLKFLSILRADLLSVLVPAALELHQITWGDPASLLEKIVAYEAVHPISNLIDLKRRLGIGRRCFGYLHPAIPGSYLLTVELNNPSKSLCVWLSIRQGDTIAEGTVILSTSVSVSTGAIGTTFFRRSYTFNCFGAGVLTGEPLIFIEVALLKGVAQTIQEVLWDDPPTLESEATCALFYSISSTQSGLAGINLGKFLIKRVIELVKRDMPQISTFATLSPIPGYMQWLLSKLGSQSKLAEADTEDTPHSLDGISGSTFRENILQPEEEMALVDSSVEFASGKNGMEVMWKLLTSKDYEWTSSDRLLSVLHAPLLRLCARYLLEEKKRGKALDVVANFHLQNGAMIERLNWMADRSVKGLCQSGGIMVNYVYRMDKIEENAQSYFSEGHIQASRDLRRYVEVIQMKEPPAERVARED